jgi:outer membrane protein OmpA-like peptidoglycan-associated protein
MPLTSEDVLGVLSDPVLQRMDFWVDSIHVRGEAYSAIADLIDREQILVVSGDDPDHSQYDSRTDTITTQLAGAPPDLFNRSRLVHECTHAIVDWEYVVTTQHINEAAVRIAQVTYLLVSDPNPAIPARYLKNHLSRAIDVAKAFNLDKVPGSGVRLSTDDFADLLKQINREPAYHKDAGAFSVANGISKKPSLKMAKLPDQDLEPRGAFGAMNAYKVPSDAMFDFNQAIVKPDAEPALQQAADYIEQFKGPSQRVYITGYTDSIGDPGYNKMLSKQRADAVARWLVGQKAVTMADVITAGEGSSKPIAAEKRPNGTDDPAGRARNRRVEILIM